MFGATLLITMPIAPSAEWAQRNMTLRSKRGSPIPGIAIKQLAIEKRAWVSGHFPHQSH